MTKYVNERLLQIQEKNQHLSIKYQHFSDDMTQCKEHIKKMKHTNNLITGFVNKSLIIIFFVSN